MGLVNSEIAPSIATGPGSVVDFRHRFASDRPGKGDLAPSPIKFDDSCRQIAEADRFFDNSGSPFPRRRDDHERHADLGPVEALTMVVQVVLPQPFAMIRSHDQQGPIEDASALQFIEQLAQFFVQVGETIIVGVMGQCLKVRVQMELVQVTPGIEYLGVGRGLGRQAEWVRGVQGDHVRRMGIEVIQEGEERTPGLSPFREPVEEFPIHRLGAGSISGQDPTE